MTRVGRWLILAAAVCLTATAAFGQEKPAEKPKTLLEEIVLFSNDLEEAYGAYKVPLGSGLTVKAGKFVTLLGYEVIESPNNLNFSRSFLFGLAIPFTHVGALLSYSPTERLTVTAGPVVGWDVAKDNNDWGGSRGTGPTTGRSSCEPPCAWSTSPTPTGTLQYKIWRGLVGRLRRTSSTGRG